MAWDITGVAAVLGVLVAIVATAWQVIRDRAPLSQLEKIDTLIKNSADKDASLALLRTARNHLRVRVALRVLVPGRRLAVAGGYSLAVVGALFLMLALLAWSLGSSPDTTNSFWSLALYGAGFLLVGLTVAIWGERSRYRSVRAVLTDHKIPDTGIGVVPFE